jgi:hypothetical protein
MANQTRRLKPALIEADKSSFAALQTFNNYSPANPAYTLAAVTQAHAEMQSAQTVEAQAEAALASARDNAVAKEWEFHNGMLGVKDQSTAQYGRNSNEVQALGRKKSSEYKAPKRSSKKKPDDK